MRAPLLALLAVTVSGCGALFMPVATPGQTGIACTAIGCESQVRFELSVDIVSDATYEVEACIDGRCESESVRVPPVDGVAVAAGAEGALVIDPSEDVVVLVLEEGDYGGTHTVSMRLSQSDGEPIEVQAETDFERLQPNGPSCEPVCWQATVRV